MGLDEALAEAQAWLESAKPAAGAPAVG
jgi:hypothetical protein